MRAPNNQTPGRPSLPPLTGVAMDFDHLTNINDINDFDKRFWEVTKGLPIRTGSILRIPSSHYIHWGIRITDENKNQLMRISDYYRSKDSVEREEDGTLERIERTAINQQLKQRMIIDIAKGLKEAMKSLADLPEINICILAAGKGDLAEMITYELLGDDETKPLVKKTKLHLVDISHSKLGVAISRIGNVINTFTYPMQDDRFLESTKAKFDIVASLCHFSKKPFKKEYFENIKSTMNQPGAIISGDWHSILCNRPIHIFELLQEMNVDNRRIDLMREIFGSLLFMGTQTNLFLGEITSLNHHYEHWLEVWNKMPKYAAKTARNPRVYMLSAYDTSRERQKTFAECGLSINIDDIKKAFPRSDIRPFRAMMRDSDRASVHFVVK